MEKIEAFVNGEPILNESANEAENYLSRTLYASRMKNFVSSGRNSTPILPSSDEIMASLSKLGSKQVCQHQFKKNDIVWICRQCQRDETCVLCNDCFQGSNHTGHEVFFYHSSSGGCCDCGDSNAWSIEGFCHRHGKTVADPLSCIPQDILPAADRIITIVSHSLISFWDAFPSLCIDDASSFSSDATGIILILNDDIHTFDDVIKAIRLSGYRGTDAAVELLTQQIHDTGQAKIFDGVISDLLPKASILRSKGLLTAVLTNSWIERMKASLICLNWLRKLAATSDGMIRLICNQFPIPALQKILRSDGYIPKACSQLIYSLFVAIMADASFKHSTSIAYATSFKEMMNNYSRGIGTNECAMFGISVQFLNREKHVSEVVEKHDFFRVLNESLLNSIPRDQSTGSFDVNSVQVRHNRYYPVFSDLKIIFALTAMSRRYVSWTCDQLLAILTLHQYNHKQTRKTGEHVKYEDDTWLNAFNFAIRISSVIDPLLNWLSDPSSTTPGHVLGFDAPHQQLLTGFELADRVLKAVRTWEITNQLTEAPTRVSMNAPFTYGGEPGSLIVYDTEADDVYSFHIILHRFYSSVVREMTYHHHHIDPLRRHFFLIRTRTYSEGALDIQSANYPMRVISFAVQIQNHRWRLNGSNMYNQLVNYLLPPFARIFKNLDLLFLQSTLAASLLPLFPSETEEEREENQASININQSVGYPLLPHLISELQLVGPSNTIASASLEETLLLIVNLLTELPPFPKPSLEERMKPIIRACLIHRLVQGPATFSQLMDMCTTSFIDAHKVRESVFHEILDDIADVREGIGMDPNKYALTKGAWDEYDPCCPLIAINAHNAAIESRPKVISPRPMVSLPKEGVAIHPLFAPVYGILGTDPTVLHLLRIAFRSIAFSRKENKTELTENEKRAYFVSVRGVTVTGLLITRALRLLTLVVQIIDHCENYRGPGEEIYHGRLKVVYDFFLEDEVVDISALGGGDASDEMTATVTLPSFLCVLEDIYESMTATSKSDNSAGASGASEKGGGNYSPENNSMQFLSWILDSLGSLTKIKKGKLSIAPTEDSFAPLYQLSKQRVMEYIRTREANNATASKAKERAIKQQRAREKALGKIKASAKAFASSLSTDQEEETEKNEEEPLNDRDLDEYTCIICQGTCLETDTDTGGRSSNRQAMGHLALCQSSKILCNRPTIEVYNADTNTDEEATTLTTAHEPPDIHVSFCGHTIHYSCFDAYFASAVEQSENQNHLVYDTSKGQFACPLCKRLNNLLIPVPQSLEYHSPHVDKIITDTSTDLTTPASVPVTEPPLLKTLKIIQERSRIPQSLFMPMPIKNMIQARGWKWDYQCAPVEIFPSYVDTNLSEDEGDEAPSAPVRMPSGLTRDLMSNVRTIFQRLGGLPARGVINFGNTLHRIAFRRRVDPSTGADNAGDVIAEEGAANMQSETMDIEDVPPQEPDLLSQLEGPPIVVGMDEEEAPSDRPEGVADESIVSPPDQPTDAPPDTSDDRMEVDVTEPPQPPPDTITDTTGGGAVPPATNLNFRINFQGFLPGDVNDFDYEIVNEGSDRPEPMPSGAHLSPFRTDIWKRFLLDYSHCLSQSKQANAPLEGSELTDHIVSVISSVTFTLSTEYLAKMIEFEVAGASKQGRFDHLRYLYSVLIDVQVTLRAYHQYDHWLQMYAVSVLGLSSIESRMRSITTADCMMMPWMTKSMMNELVTSLMLFAPSPVSTISKFPELCVSEAAKFPCLGHLMQLIFMGGMDALMRLRKSSSSDRQLFTYHPYRPPIHEQQTMERSDAPAAGLSGPLQHYQVYGFFCELRDVILQTIVEMVGRDVPYQGIKFTDLTLPDVIERDILWRWVSFMRNTHQIIHRLSVAPNADVIDLAPCSSPLLMTDNYVNDALQCLSIRLYENSSIGRERDVLMTVARGWLHDLKICSLGGLKCARSICETIQTQRFPRATAPTLVPLPESYTTLHSWVSTKYSYEYQAICMTCGAVLDIKPKGACSSHMPKCTGETGIFFLVQECTLLYCYGPRSYYMHAPYVDDYGDRHRTHRGKPLQLDPRRVSMLQIAWLKHEIAREVTLKRSTAARVIVLGNF